MNHRQQRIERMRSVEREFLAARSAAELVETQLQTDPQWGIARGWQVADASNLAANLEITYIIRLFAEFEAGLRDCWQSYFLRKPKIDVGNLIDSIAAKRSIPQDWLESAHVVRMFRNVIVHEKPLSDLRQLAIEDARSHLCRYFSRLPLRW